MSAWFREIIHYISLDLDNGQFVLWFKVEGIYLLPMITLGFTLLIFFQKTPFYIHKAGFSNIGIKNELQEMKWEERHEVLSSHVHLKVFCIKTKLFITKTFWDSVQRLVESHRKWLQTFPYRTSKLWWVTYTEIKTIRTPVMKRNVSSPCQQNWLTQVEYFSLVQIMSAKIHIPGMIPLCIEILPENIKIIFLTDIWSGEGNHWGQTMLTWFSIPNDKLLLSSLQSIYCSLKFNITEMQSNQPE